MCAFRPSPSARQAERRSQTMSLRSVPAVLREVDAPPRDTAQVQRFAATRARVRPAARRTGSRRCVFAVAAVRASLRVVFCVPRLRNTVAFGLSAGRARRRLDDVVDKARMSAPGPNWR